jgi:hypothetical protein
LTENEFESNLCGAIGSLRCERKRTVTFILPTRSLEHLFELDALIAAGMGKTSALGSSVLLELSPCPDRPPAGPWTPD